MTYPTRKGFHLAEWAEDAYAAWDGDCSCHLSPPCNSCLQEGNPEQLESNDKAWLPDASPTAAFDAIKEMLA